MPMCHLPNAKKPDPSRTGVIVHPDSSERRCRCVLLMAVLFPGPCPCHYHITYVKRAVVVEVSGATGSVMQLVSGRQRSCQEVQSGWVEAGQRRWTAHPDMWGERPANAVLVTQWARTKDMLPTWRTAPLSSIIRSVL